MYYIGCIGLTFGKDVKLDKGTRAWLLIEFHGKLTENLEGFYCNPYKDAHGNLRMGCATMFAATEARSCFPCFDEPDFKAIFALEVTVPKKLMVISNMPHSSNQSVFVKFLKKLLSCFVSLHLKKSNFTMSIHSGWQPTSVMIFV